MLRLSVKYSDLRRLPNKLDVRKVIMAAATQVARDARSNVEGGRTLGGADIPAAKDPKAGLPMRRSGQLARSIGARWSKKDPSVAWVGPSTGKRKGEAISRKRIRKMGLYHFKLTNYALHAMHAFGWRTRQGRVPPRINVMDGDGYNGSRANKKATDTFAKVAARAASGAFPTRTIK